MSTLLLDADIVAFKVAVLHQKDFDWGDTGHSRVVDPIAAKQHTDELIAEYCNTLKASSVIVCLSEPDPELNFRRQLNPSYKSNRKEAELPELLMWVKDYLAAEYRSFRRPRLEADDIMGILATCGDRFGMKGADPIIVSEDKDMLTIPARVYNPNKPDLGVIEVSELEADQFMLWQAIVGDPTDGYPGCFGAGPKSYWAQAIWCADRAELWDIVMDAYDEFDFTEEDALLQVRMAHILRASSYNFKKKRVKLWKPSWL